MPKKFYELLTAGLFLGTGMGGFIDGILFHQILQIHNLLSNKIFPDSLVNLEINMFWDGIFHAFTWIMTLIGILFLWKISKNEEIPKNNSSFFGSMIMGFGLFNLIEGTIDHQLLSLHHVIQRTNYFYQFLADMLFLISGILLITMGVYLIKKK